jgi:phosphate transport system substrate-binding protein
MVTDEVRNAVKTIAVNGILPNQETISNRQYPFVAEVYAIIRSDLDKNSMAYKLYELLQTVAGKNVIAESGYIPN